MDMRVIIVRIQNDMDTDLKIEIQTRNEMWI